MAKFIEVHKKAAGNGGKQYSFLQNLDDVSVVIHCPGDTAVIVLRSSPHGTAHFEVLESYDQLRRMIGAAQGGIPMDVDKGGCY